MSHEVWPFKKCSNCGLYKEESEFYIGENGKYGLFSQCNECLTKQEEKNKELRERLVWLGKKIEG